MDLHHSERPELIFYNVLSQDVETPQDYKVSIAHDDFPTPKQQQHDRVLVPGRSSSYLRISHARATQTCAVKT